jgi:hypothetical protein
MIDKKKIALFVIITILLISTLAFQNINYYVLIPMYIGFILVGLYDLGNDEFEREEAEKKNNKAE